MDCVIILLHNYSHKKKRNRKKIGFAVTTPNPYELVEKPYDPNAKKPDNADKQDVETIPTDTLQECIKLGLKGPLLMSPVGKTGWAIFMAVLCVLVAIAAIAVICLTGPVGLFFGGILLGAAIGGAVNAIKGAVNGDFSFRQFGINIGIGAITGLVTGGVTAGLGAVMAPIVQGASRLVHIGAGIAIGSISGAVGAAIGGVTRHLMEYGNLDNFDFKNWGISIGLGALGGGIGGGIGGAFVAPGYAGALAPLLNQGFSGVAKAALQATTAAIITDFALQGIMCAINGERFNINVSQLLEIGLTSGFVGGIMHKAQQIVRSKQAQKQSKKQMQEALERNQRQQNQKVTIKPDQNHVDTQINDSRLNLPFEEFELDRGYVGVGKRNPEFSNPRRHSVGGHERSMADVDRWRRQPEIHEKGKAWTNMPPRPLCPLSESDRIRADQILTDIRGLKNRVNNLRRNRNDWSRNFGDSDSQGRIPGGSRNEYVTNLNSDNRTAIMQYVANELRGEVDTSLSTSGYKIRIPYSWESRDYNYLLHFR